jgi:diphthamide biosynthesis protein 2
LKILLCLNRGRQWTGEYLLDFQDFISITHPAVVTNGETGLKEQNEARFSFFKGGYVEDIMAPRGIFTFV